MEEEAPQKKTRGKRKVARPSVPTRLPPSKVAKTQEKPRGVRPTKVTPSPPKQSHPQVMASSHHAPRRRDSFMTDYLVRPPAGTVPPTGRVAASAQLPLVGRTNPPQQKNPPETANFTSQSEPQQQHSRSVSNMRERTSANPSHAYRPPTATPVDTGPDEHVQPSTTWQRRGQGLPQDYVEGTETQPRIEERSQVQTSSAATPAPWAQASRPSQQATKRQGVQSQQAARDQSARGRTFGENSFASPPMTSTMWRQQRREQQRSQKHAFARNKENPFAKYQYDPNDSESVLDSLSQKATPPRFSTPSTIIPRDRQRAFDLAHQRAFQNSTGRVSTTTTHLGIRGRQTGGGPRQQRRRFFSLPSAVQVQETPMTMPQTASRLMNGMTQPPGFHTPAQSGYIPTPHHYTTPAFPPQQPGGGGMMPMQRRPFVSPNQQNLGTTPPYEGTNAHPLPYNAAATQSGFFMDNDPPAQNNAAPGYFNVQSNYGEPVPQQAAFDPKHGSSIQQHHQSPYFITHQSQPLVSQEEEAFSREPITGAWDSNFSRQSTQAPPYHGEFQGGSQDMSQFEGAFF